ncbi:VPLPA-CTERM sorting domain-containing protein [uncultured Roseobacter sp.]|uniref:VPLPA-CTERM sorting domain-containing protein n=1 Tax=uncultured Roseobacter sp. TaxID=114847 RepID=UPI00261BE8DD|nr:VPLPA-CTERM sorting domain-containing protein [uncultured Roseobacter sp.]
MNLNSFKGGAVAAVLTAATLFATDVGAATMYEGTYDATSVNTNGNDHTVWLPGLFTGVSAYWQFAPNPGSFVVGANNATAQLSGTIQNNGVSNYQMQVDVSYELRNPNVPGDTTKNGGGAYDGTWSFFDIAKATITGIGDLSGLSLILSVYPDPQVEDIPFQLGEGANDKNSGLGASGWFSWETQISQIYIGPDAFDSKKHGDINLNLRLNPDSNIPDQVPLPAAAFLLIAGLGGLGGLRMYKRKS